MTDNGFIVVWSVGTKQDAKDNNLTNHWEYFEEHMDAQEKYVDITNRDDTFTASVTEVIESTDE